MKRVLFQHVKPVRASLCGAEFQHSRHGVRGHWCGQHDGAEQEYSERGGGGNAESDILCNLIFFFRNMVKRGCNDWVTFFFFFFKFNGPSRDKS